MFCEGESECSTGSSEELQQRRITEMFVFAAPTWSIEEVNMKSRWGCSFLIFDNKNHIWRWSVPIMTPCFWYCGLGHIYWGVSWVYKTWHPLHFLSGAQQTGSDSTLQMKHTLHIHEVMACLKLINCWIIRHCGRDLQAEVSSSRHAVSVVCSQRTFVSWVTHQHWHKSVLLLLFVGDFIICVHHNSLPQS